MPGAINVAKLEATVDIRGQQCKVRGLEAETIFYVLGNFDEVRKMWDLKRFDAAGFAKLSGPAAAYIISQSIEELDEENADNLSISEKVEILAKIWKISAPKGIGPFVELMEALGVGAPSDSRPAMKSPRPSKNSGATDTPTHADTRLAS